MSQIKNSTAIMPAYDIIVCPTLVSVTAYFSTGTLDINIKNTSNSKWVKSLGKGLKYTLKAAQSNKQSKFYGFDYVEIKWKVDKKSKSAYIKRIYSSDNIDTICFEAK